LQDLVTFAWETGARAQECLLVERRHLEEHRIVLPVEDEKMQRAPRIIYLTETAEAILQRLALRHPKGPIFRNTKGEPWTPDAVVCAFGQLRGRMGRKVLYDEEFEIPESEINELIPHLSQNRRSGDQKTDKELREEARRKLWDRHAKDKAPRYCLTAFRHSFAHRLLRSGVDALTVSVLMGHVDPSMVARVYSHLSHAPDYLRESLKR
jgi:integrase